MSALHIILNLSPEYSLLSDTHIQSTDNIPSTFPPFLTAPPHSPCYTTNSSLLLQQHTSTAFTEMTETEIDSRYTTTPYECINEPRPDSVVYTAGFRELQELNREAASLLRKPLEDSKF